MQLHNPKSVQYRVANPLNLSHSSRREHRTDKLPEEWTEHSLCLCDGGVPERNEWIEGKENPSNICMYANRQSLALQEKEKDAFVDAKTAKQAH